MAQRLRVIAQHLPAGRINLLREQAKLAAQGYRLPQQLLGLIAATAARQRIDQPEGAGEEGALIRSLAAGREVPVEEDAAGAQAPADRIDRGLDAFRLPVLELRHGNQQ